MSVELTSPSAPSPVQPEPLRVMLVDDSVVIRGMISSWLSSAPDIVVAASLRTGLEAVNQVERINSDIAILDIEMSELDGISSLPKRRGGGRGRGGGGAAARARRGAGSAGK